MTATLVELAGLPSVSGQEADVRAYLAARLDERLGLESQVDAAGNLIALMPGTPIKRAIERPLLLNAPMDRVPPGKAHPSIVADGVMRSDGTTNLGADDSAGLAVILHIAEELHWRNLPHPPLVLLFTTGEEVGLTGAGRLDPAPRGATEGIAFDNSGETGEGVTHAATY